MPRFLLVSLNIKAILQETTLYRRREKLGTMIIGSGLRDAYDSTIGRIKAQEGDRARLGMAALMWISHSERPLKVDEICHALAVEIGLTDMYTNNVPSIRTVLGCCQSLAAIDEGSSTIRLIHFTLKEYLSGHADLFGQPHSKIAETCLTYLNSQAIRDLAASHSRDLQSTSFHDNLYWLMSMGELSDRTPFLEYSSLYWGTHMQMELSDRSIHLALDLLAQYDSHISANSLSVSIAKGLPNAFKPFSALRCIAYFGIFKVAIDLIRMKGCDVNQRDRMGLTLLMWAARYGREEIVNFLLQQEHTQPDMVDTRYGRTALSWAAGSGHEVVVGLFLGPPFVNTGSRGRRWGKAPQVMKPLFGRKYASPDRPDNSGRTPLWWAAYNRHDGVVKLLLRREDVNPDRSDNDGRNPLLWATQEWA